MKTTKYLIISMLLACVALYGCQEIEESIENLPTIKTNAVEKIGTTTAYLTGYCSSGSSICFYLSATKDFASCQRITAHKEKRTPNTYYAELKDLKAGTTYYCAISASDGHIEQKGNIVQFTTKKQFEFDKVTHTAWESGKTEDFISETYIGSFFFYNEKYRYNNVQTSCTLDEPRWTPYTDLSLDMYQMMAYAYWPYTQTYEMRDNQPYIPVDNNGQDYLYGACEYISNENTPTNMHMNSAMSRVTFTVNKTEDCDIEGTVSEIILVDNGKTFYHYGEMNVATGEISYLAESMYNASIHCKFELSDNTPTTVERLMFPTSFGENQIQVGIKIAQTNEIIYQYLPAGEWKKGQTYNYPITLTKVEEELTEGDAIDLGLSVMWASKNVGANSPEEYGGYFAWGETSLKSSYYYGSSVTYNLSITELESKSIIDADGNLTASYDVATAKMGSDWRMPTSAEIQELRDKCTWKWTTQNGVNGRKVIGPNGNSIFLPAAGYRSGSDLGWEGAGGHYWSASPASDSYGAYSLSFSSIDYNRTYDNRYDGHSVRPVYDPQTTTALIVGDVQVENWGTNNEGGTIIVQQ